MGNSKSNTTEFARETAAIVAAAAAAAVTATPGTIETAACTSGATGVVDAAGAAAAVGAAVVAGMTRAEAAATLTAETAITACTLIGHQPAGLSPMAMEKSKRKTIKFAIETAAIAATATAVKTTPETIEVVEPLALEGVMSNGHGGAGNDLSAVVKTAAAITGGDRDSVVESFVASRKRGRKGEIEASGKAQGTSANIQMLC